MLMPKKVKHRKVQKNVKKGLAYRGSTIEFGDYGLKALEFTWITSRQLESARIAINRTMKRGGKMWIRIFPDKPITSKPAETRMGKGKGALDHWVAVVKAGKIMFEVQGVDKELAKKALTLASHKLPIKTKFVTREEFGE